MTTSAPTTISGRAMLRLARLGSYLCTIVSTRVRAVNERAHFLSREESTAVPPVHRELICQWW